VRMHALLEKAGVPNKLITLKGRGHGGFSREEMVSSYAAIREFLRKNNVLKAE
jgi:dipeptidyl aminopeptidase/acylaminoacyl peptidase